VQASGNKLLRGHLRLAGGVRLERHEGEVVGIKWLVGTLQLFAGQPSFELLRLRQLHNNPAENVIRPIALGRKNWLFAGSKSAGRRAAAIMSLLATAKADGHDPHHAWVCDVLERLPTTRASDIASLLPHTW